MFVALNVQERVGFFVFAFLRYDINIALYIILSRDEILTTHQMNSVTQNKHLTSSLIIPARLRTLLSFTSRNFKEYTERIALQVNCHNTCKEILPVSHYRWSTLSRFHTYISDSYILKCYFWLFFFLAQHISFYYTYRYDFANKYLITLRKTRKCAGIARNTVKRGRALKETAIYRRAPVAL